MRPVCALLDLGFGPRDTRGLLSRSMLEVAQVNGRTAEGLRT